MDPTATSATTGIHRPGAAWYVLAVLATGVGGYGIALQDGRPVRDAVPGVPWLDELHFLTGGVALVVGVWCFRRDLLTRARAWHRRLGLAYVAAALASGLAGLGMAVWSGGGVAGHLGFALLAVLWLASTALGWRRIRRRDIAGHRRSMVVSYALACAAITLRIELPLLVLATGSFALAYPIVAWACWLPNLAFAGWRLARTDTDGRHRARR
jgi:uncharacterized membrane protein